MSAKHAILGLVVEQRGYAWRIAVEARRQFRFAELAGSYPYWALEKLEAEGLVRQVYENGAPVGNGGAGRKAIYEATVRGVRVFEDWLQSTPGESSLRDDVQFRLAVARPSDLPRIVELIREREFMCVAREQALAQHVLSADPKCGSVDRSALHDLARDAQLTFWRGQADWLKRVREDLEGMSGGPRGSR